MTQTKPEIREHRFEPAHPTRIARLLQERIDIAELPPRCLACRRRRQTTRLQPLGRLRQVRLHLLLHFALEAPALKHRAQRQAKPIQHTQRFPEFVRRHGSARVLLTRWSSEEAS